MLRYEYMKLKISLILEEIIIQYNLLTLVHSGFIYIEIRKGKYRLPQAGILANKLLMQRLAVFGYSPCEHTPGLWKHVSRPIKFSLVVENFGVHYTGRENAEHLINAIKSNYEMLVDWQG